MDKTSLMTTKQLTVEPVTSQDQAPADTYVGIYWLKSDPSKVTFKKIVTDRVTHPEQLVTVFSDLAFGSGLPKENTRCRIVGTTYGHTVTYLEQGATMADYEEVLREMSGVAKLNNQDRKQLSKAARAVGFKA